MPTRDMQLLGSVCNQDTVCGWLWDVTMPFTMSSSPRSPRKSQRFPLNDLQDLNDSRSTRLVATVKERLLLRLSNKLLLDFGVPESRKEFPDPRLTGDGPGDGTSTSLPIPGERDLCLLNALMRGCDFETGAIDPTTSSDALLPKEPREATLCPKARILRCEASLRSSEIRITDVEMGFTMTSKRFESAAGFLSPEGPQTTSSCRSHIT